MEPNVGSFEYNDKIKIKWKEGGNSRMEIEFIQPKPKAKYKTLNMLGCFSKDT